MPSGCSDPEAGWREGRVRSRLEPPLALLLLVIAPAQAFFAFMGHLTFDWVDPRTLTKEEEWKSPFLGGSASRRSRLRLRGPLEGFTSPAT